MVAQLVEFEPICGIDGLYTATKGELRCAAIRLKSGGLCLHSPVAGLSVRAQKSLTKLGNVEFLLAPNCYHNKGVAEYANMYPTAQIVAPQNSHLRLERITKLKFHGLEELSAKLPTGMQLVSPAGLKTGEVWLIASSPRYVGWLVVDAFAGAKNSSREDENTVQLLGTFPKYGLKDCSDYQEWLKHLLRSQPPDILIPCHGGIVRSDDLSIRMQELVAEIP